MKNKKCAQCNKPTKNPKFCSKSCSAIFNNIKNPKRKKKPEPLLLCQNPECKNTFTKNRGSTGRYCKKTCFHEHTKIKKIEKFLEGKLNDLAIRKTTIRNFLIKRQGGLCLICGNPPIHNKKPIVFIVDHIDGNWKNNDEKNIRAICPNCNSQTDTFTGKNMKSKSGTRKSM